MVASSYDVGYTVRKPTPAEREEAPTGSKAKNAKSVSVMSQSSASVPPASKVRAYHFLVFQNVGC